MLFLSRDEVASKQAKQRWFGHLAVDDPAFSKRSDRSVI